MRAFVLEDIENYFKTAQKALESQDDEQEMNRPDPSQMVESWLFACSKKIELKEAFNFPRMKNFSLKSPPTADRVSLNGKLNSSLKQNASQYSLSSTMSSGELPSNLNSSMRPPKLTKSRLINASPQKPLNSSLNLSIPPTTSNSNLDQIGNYSIGNLEGNYLII